MSQNLLHQLVAEAFAGYSTAAASDVSDSSGEERGGRPARRFLNGPGGPAQRAFYQAPGLLTFLRQLTHHSLEPTGNAGTYSYYARPGDFLAVHRDIVTCDVAVITCLTDNRHAAGGALRLYPTRVFDRVAAIRKTPDIGAYDVRLDIGQTIALYGGIVPHALRPVESGQLRIVSVLCYRIAAAPSET